MKDSAKPARETVDAAIGIINFFVQRKGELNGVPTGFTDLDQMTFGLQKQEMIVLAARPSMGKTSLALNIADHAALPPGDRKPTPTLVFSLEMSAEQLALRLICARAKVNMKRVKAGFLDGKGQDLSQAGTELKRAPSGSTIPGSYASSTSAPRPGAWRRSTSWG